MNEWSSLELRLGNDILMTIIELLISKKGTPKISISSTINAPWIYWNFEEDCWNVAYRIQNRMEIYKTYDEEQAVAMLLSLEGFTDEEQTNFE